MFFPKLREEKSRGVSKKEIRKTGTQIHLKCCTEEPFLFHLSEQPKGVLTEDDCLFK